MKAPRTRLRLRVVPGTARPGIVGRYGDAWKVRVTARPERGKANEAVLELLAGTLGVPRHDLELKTGHASRDKIVALAGVTEDEADTRLAAAVERA